MPKRKSSGRKTSKKSRKKSKTSRRKAAPKKNREYKSHGRARPSVLRLPVIPARIRTVFDYYVAIPATTVGTLAGSASTIYDMRANSIYDPDETLGSGSRTTRQHPVWTGIYKFYNVYKCELMAKVQAINTGSSDNEFGHVYWDIANTASGAHCSSLQALMLGYRYRPKQVTFGDQATSGNKWVTLTQTCLPNKVIPEESAAEYWSTYNANPVTVVRARLAYMNTTRVTQTGFGLSISGWIRVRMHATLKEIAPNRTGSLF